MNRVIFQPAGKGDPYDHFRETVQNPVRLESIRQYLNETDLASLKQLFPSGETMIWGVTPSKDGRNRKYWEAIEPRDVTLFSGFNKIYAQATIVYKTHNKDLAFSLWGQRDDGRTWEYIYFLQNLRMSEITYDEFNPVVGYSDNYIIQGFWRADEEKSRALFTHFNLLANSPNPQFTQNDYLEALNKLDGEEKLDKKYQANRRVEQSYLRNYLFGAFPTGTCGICSNEYPICFLVAAHIKKRSECSRIEKLDVDNIVMPMCKFGCDELFEEGFISVKSGKVVSLVEEETTKSVKEYLKTIVGNTCEYYSASSYKYFAWHFNYHVD